MLGLEDLAHAALADRVDDLIGAEIELRAADLELFGLPAIEPAHLDQLGGQCIVADFDPRADRRPHGAQGSSRPRGSARR